MLSKNRTRLTEGEKREVLQCGILPRKMGHWFSKKEVLHTISNWDRYSDYVTVSTIGWNENNPPWGVSDDVPRLCLTFDLYHGRDLDDLIGHLFQASIDGYSIRYVSTDCLVGLYLERSKDHSTNIDEDVLDLLVKFGRERWTS